MLTKLSIETHLLERETMSLVRPELSKSKKQSNLGAGVKCEVRVATSEVVKCEVPVRGINAR